MELFFREKFWPHRAPCRGRRPEIVRLDLVALRIGRGQDPWLRASHEHMRNRNQPRPVVERAGAKVDDFGTSRPVTVEPAAAIPAKPGYDRDARRRRVAPSFRLALQHVKILGTDRHVQRESAAGGPLTIRAIAGVEQERKRCDLIADRAARAGAGHRKGRSPQRHDEGRSKMRSTDYTANDARATPISP